MLCPPGAVCVDAQLLAAGLIYEDTQLLAANYTESAVDHEDQLHPHDG
jgi:hypothetical protein